MYKKRTDLLRTLELVEPTVALLPLLHDLVPAERSITLLFVQGIKDRWDGYYWTLSKDICVKLSR